MTSLHNTVIRIALVKLSKSYSRISLEEIAAVLQLENAEEARYTCMRVGLVGADDCRISAMVLFRDGLRTITSLQRNWYSLM